METTILLGLLLRVFRMEYQMERNAETIVLMGGSPEGGDVVTTRGTHTLSHSVPKWKTN